MSLRLRNQIVKADYGGENGIPDCRSNTPSAWPEPASILRSGASVAATTTRWSNRTSPIAGNGQRKQHKNSI